MGIDNFDPFCCFCDQQVPAVEQVVTTFPVIPKEWLAEVYEQQKDLLDAEGLSPDGLIDLLGRASTLGFAVAEPAGWRLLPAVCRYLDHFEGLAATSREDDNEPDVGTEDNADDVLSDEEID